MPDLITRDGQTYRVIMDHLGSPVFVVNIADGTILDQAQYNEWGRVIAQTNPTFTPFGFAGGLEDQDTRLVRFGARDYNPNTGRWISKDPIGFNSGDVNLYRYTANNPVNLIDPLGLKTKGIGFSGTYSGFGFSGTFGVQYVKDDKGNTGYSVTYGVGAGGAVPNFTITLDFTNTNASTISDLEGPGAQTGGGLSTGIGAAGIEAAVGDSYIGTTGSIGAGAPGYSAYNIVTNTNLFGTNFDNANACIMKEE